MKKVTLITALSFVLFGCLTPTPKEEVVSLTDSTSVVDSTIIVIDTVKVDSIAK